MPNFETITDAYLDEVRADLDKVRRIRKALADYHFALDTRRNGNIAMHNFVYRVEAILDARWEDGAEKKRRSGQ